MRNMQREITVTVAEVVEIGVGEQGVEVIKLPAEILEGKVEIQKAEKLVGKKYPERATKVVKVTEVTRKYEMPVLKFVENATVIDGEPVEAQPEKAE